MKSSVLILPGIGNSGPQHWQSLWELAHPNFQRVNQRDWNNPVCAEWVDTLEQAVKLSNSRPVLVAHSLACLVVASWAASTHLPINGALLVAVPDPHGPNFPSEAVGFTSIPRNSFAFPSIVAASSDDPYGSLEYSQGCARDWGSRLHNIGPAGHINAASGLGDWSEGLQLLADLLD